MAADASDLLKQATSLGNAFVGLPQMPWEGGNAVGRILEPGGGVPWLRGPVVPRNMPNSCHVARDVEQTSFSEVKKTLVSKVHTCLEEDPDVERARSLKKLCDLLMFFDTGTSLGRHLIDAENIHAPAGQLIQILSDSMAKKSTSTIKTRVGSVAMYVKWFHNEMLGGDKVQITEPLVYRYLCYLRDLKAPATRGSTFMESLTFCHHCLGFDRLNEVLNSPRCLGVAHCMYLLKAPTAQADPFPAWIVGVFEIAVIFGGSLRMKAEAGLVLMGIHGRFRASDLKCIKAGGLNKKIFECELLATKTSRRSAIKARTFLPGSVLRVGLLGSDWVCEFLEARRRLGLKDLPTKRACIRTGLSDFVLLPSETYEIGEKEVAMSSKEVTQAIHDILGRVLPKATATSFTSHSMKSTWLSAYNEWECDYDIQSLLGYHVVKGRTSATTYSGHALALPMRRLAKMLGETRAGTFVPNGAGGANFRRKNVALNIKAQIEEHCGMKFPEIRTALGNGSPLCSDVSELSPTSLVPSEEGAEDAVVRVSDSDDDVVDDRTAGSVSDADVHPNKRLRVESASDSSTSSENSSESSGESSDEAAHAAIESTHLGDRVRDIARHSALTLVYRHKSRRTLHYGHTEDSSKLACGRDRSLAFVPFAGDVERAWPRCKVCFGV